MLKQPNTTHHRHLFGRGPRVLCTDNETLCIASPLVRLIHTYILMPSSHIHACTDPIPVTASREISESSLIMLIAWDNSHSLVLASFALLKGDPVSELGLVWVNLAPNMEFIGPYGRRDETKTRVLTSGTCQSGVSRQ